jgi:hypothetical protein
MEAANSKTVPIPLIYFASGSARMSGGLLPFGPIRDRGSIGLTLSGFTPSHARRAGPVEPFRRFTE